MERLQIVGLLVLIAASSSLNTTDGFRPGPEPSYLILAPRSLRSGIPASVSVTILTSSLPVVVSAQILLANKTLASNSATVEGGSTKLLTLPPIDESDSIYSSPFILEVRGHTGGVQVFSNSTKLHFSTVGLSTIIQTDRPKYQPGQVVRIRAVSIRPDGRPEVSPVDVIVRDPRGNLLRQWLDVDGVLGVVSREFELSENPPLGDWTIVTTVRDVSSEKKFTVAHYVLPKFEVVIKAPDVIYYQDTVDGVITAKYMYGKPVRGHMNITYIHHFHGIDEAFDEDREIDGTDFFSFDVPIVHMNMRPSRMIYYDGSTQFLKIVVHVTEHLTGLTYNSTTKVMLTRNRYKLTFEDYPKTLKPFLNFTARLKISTYNNKPLSLADQQKIVEVSAVQRKQTPWVWIMEGREKPESTNASDPEDMDPKGMEFPVPVDGVIPLSIEIMNETESLYIDASFEDSSNTLQLHRSYTSPSQSYLQIQKPSRPPEVGSSLHLHIEKNFATAAVHYMVKSRGLLVAAGTSSEDLTLVPEVSWAPLASIIVYCVSPKGEVINDVIQLPIRQFLHNQVSLSWSESKKRPAEQVNLRVTVAEPGSLVGILVVDKATRWAGSHNDITEEAVLKEIQQFGDSVVDGDTSTLRIGDPYTVFKTVDLIPLTDADLHVQTRILEWLLFREEMFDVTQTHNLPMEQQQEPHERTNFPETWIWMDVNTSDSTTKQIPLTVPDSITSWTATAFVMSEKLGLGLVKQPAELTVFQDFFLSLNLPAYIIRGEVLVLEVILFNYLQQDQQVRVIVAESETFEFVFPDDEVLSMASVRQVYVESQSGATVLVPIRPLTLGKIPISVKATTAFASDLVRRTVLVKAEGLEESFSSSLIMELSPSEPFLSGSLSFSFPPDVVEGSGRASVTAVGDILGPSISGLDSLIQMPHGCGEQNMINFAPNVYVLQYLSSTGQSSQDVRDRARGYMLKGYERELTFQREDGSFSAFGDQDSSGSTWLSAFVLRCFLQARPFIPIEDHVLKRAAYWIGAQQGADGRFEEPGRVIHTELQGGLDGPVSLTAYVLLALLGDADIKAQYESRVSAALMYLEGRLALGVSSNYSLGLMAYALALAGSSSAERALSDLIGRAEMKDGVPMWSSLGGGLSSSWQPRSADIEMASYVLLSLHQLDRVSEGVGLMKWLSRQRNHGGGFGSTQDTVVALQALSTFAGLVGTRDFNIRVRVKSDASTTVATFSINQENHLLHQSQQIEPEDELNLQVTAEGQGLVLVQLNVFYNVRTEVLMRRRRDAGERDAFHLNVKLFDSDLDSCHLFICTRLSQGLGLNMTGMAILEVGLLSGLSLQEDGVQTNQVVKRVETQPGKVVLYLDSVTTEEMCLEIPLVMEYKVAKVQDATALIYDYYEPRRRTAATYNSWRMSHTETCQLCGDDCSLCGGKYEGYFLDAAQRCSLHFLLRALPPALLLLLLLLPM
ncbi:CD109 antigen isoform X2 [Mugil cephalus]|uniref:CD109 antigen isoform X2 n=1 Tax=Mugil cephalus TaxID=48193 RepID=UPI001FB7BCB5|nr:CD109 antigen isoform X2 [Mugil cephalus]